MIEVKKVNLLEECSLSCTINYSVSRNHNTMVYKFRFFQLTKCTINKILIRDRFKLSEKPGSPI